MPDRLPAFPDFEHSLPMLLLRARESVMERFRPTLREFGLTEQQWRVIRVLAEVDELDASELARRSFILAPSLTRILQNLEARKIVRRRRADRDQRRALISLGARGRRLFERVRPHSRRSYAEIAATLGPDRVEALYDLLEEVEARLARSGGA